MSRSKSPGGDRDRSRSRAPNWDASVVFDDSISTGISFESSWRTIKDTWSVVVTELTTFSMHCIKCVCEFDQASIAWCACIFISVVYWLTQWYLKRKHSGPDKTRSQFNVGLATAMHVFFALWCRAVWGFRQSDHLKTQLKKLQGKACLITFFWVLSSFPKWWWGVIPHAITFCMLYITQQARLEFIPHNTYFVAEGCFHYLVGFAITILFPTQVCKKDTCYSHAIWSINMNQATYSLLLSNDRVEHDLIFYQWSFKVCLVLCTFIIGFHAWCKSQTITDKASLRQKILYFVLEQCLSTFFLCMYYGPKEDVQLFTTRTILNQWASPKTSLEATDWMPTWILVLNVGFWAWLWYRDNPSVQKAMDDSMPMQLWLKKVEAAAAGNQQQQGQQQSDHITVYVILTNPSMLSVSVNNMSLSDLKNQDFTTTWKTFGKYKCGLVWSHNAIIDPALGCGWFVSKLNRKLFSNLISTTTLDQEEAVVQKAEFYIDKDDNIIGFEFEIPFGSFLRQNPTKQDRETLHEKLASNKYQHVVAAVVDAALKRAFIQDCNGKLVVNDANLMAFDTALKKQAANTQFGRQKC